MTTALLYTYLGGFVLSLLFLQWGEDWHWGSVVVAALWPLLMVYIVAMEIWECNR